MIDLTPLDVRKKRGDFRRLLRGYDPEEVDTFLDLVAERLEELVRENLALSDRLEGMEAQLKSLEGRETAIQEALVSAQKLREEVGDQSRREAESLKEQANRTAEIVKGEAEAYITRRLAEADSLVMERQRALGELERSRLKFLKAFRSLLEREMDAVEVEEARRPLEDVTLELDFRGWTSAGASVLEEEDAAEAEAEVREEGDAAEAEAEVQEEEDSAEAGAEVLEEEDAAEAEGEVLEEEDAAEAEAEVREESPESAGFGIQEEPRHSGETPPGEGEEGSDQPTPEIPREPRWLFSLLKTEDEERAGED